MFNIMVWAFMTDIIDYHQYSTGMREDGTIFSVNMFGRKMAQTAMGILSGLSLTYIGYQASSTGSTVQSQSVLNGLYSLATLVPFVLMLAGALILTFWFPLNKRKLTEVADKLKVLNKVDN